MLYLTGATSDRDEPGLIASGIGLMVQRGNSYHRRCGRYPFFAADIGMAGDDVDAYLDYLDRLPRGRCLFAVSPDAYPDPVESLRRGVEHAPLIRAMGFPAAVVAQDGAEALDWPWEELDCLFIGGERRRRPADEWKVGPGAERLARRARAAGKWVHMGRVNGEGRLERARSMGCLSADGTFVKYRRRRRARDADALAVDARGASELSGWLDRLDAAPMLPAFAALEAPAHPLHRELAAGRPARGGV